MVGNCLPFALYRWFTRGGYLVIRRSHFGYWPHFIWCSDLRDAQIEHWVPRKRLSRFRILEVLLKLFPFPGYIKKSDELPRPTKRNPQ